jgi:CheY-like chemotaxis protein
VIAISANAMEKDIQEALKLGFAGYLTKPIDVPVFIEKLKDILK